MSEADFLALVEANLRAALAQLVDPWAVRHSAAVTACNARLQETRQARLALLAEKPSLAHIGAAKSQAFQRSTMH